MLQLRYGTSPLSGTSSQATQLPTQHTTLASLTVKVAADIHWKDINGGMRQTYRNSFLIDMFLSSVKPNGTPIGNYVTDEIVVDIAYNSQYAPGCTGFPQRPLESFTDRYGNVWLYWIQRNGDKPGSGSTNRMNHFTLQGGGETEKKGSVDLSLDLSVDLLPIIQKVQNRSGDYSATWLGDITFGSALYDNTQGQLTFPSLPIINANHHHQASTVV